jgi:hypothetical protein
VLDRKGRWSIWVISDHPDWNKTMTLDCVSSGISPQSRPDTQDPDNRQRDSPSDGWGVILWVKDISTIMVARRSTLALCSRINNNPQNFEQKLGVSEGRDWILDVSRDPLVGRQIFVLTSSKLYWLTVGIEEASAEQGLKAEILLSRQHFRNRFDFGLRMAITVAQEGMDCWKSRMNDH